MAADILAYRATHVPVGDDQKQHLELARDNRGRSLTTTTPNRSAPRDFRWLLPAAWSGDHGACTRVMSLRDGTKKMSKSDASDLSRINMTDDADTIARKIQKAKDRSRGTTVRGGRPREPSGGGQSCRHLRGASKARRRRPCSRCTAAPVLQASKRPSVELAVVAHCAGGTRR